MKYTLLSTILGTACALLAIQSLFSPSLRAAGDLAPTGPPTPTMVSLADLAAQVEKLQETLEVRIPGGKNLALASSNGTISAWDNESRTWTDTNLGGLLIPIGSDDLTEQP